MSKKKKSMPVIGLTGGIGMGKSTVAALLREFGLPVYEADKVVHGLLQKGGKAVGPVGRIFAATLERGEINRAELGAIVFASPVKLKALEKILHPLVRRAENEFLRKARRDDAAAAILEIPLLFETGGHKRCDFTLCVTAPKKVQMARVMQRPGMTQTKLKGILSRQLPDAKKRKLADFTIDTGGTRAQTKKQLRAALDTIFEGLIMREIIFDTETTGLDPLQGHRVVEIGCVELLNHVPTGRTWQSYLNPQREMPVEAAIVHGLKDEFLFKQPLFAEVVEAFLEFIGDAPLVAHNANFDMGFINAELARHGFTPLAAERAIDTVAMARRMFPGAPASLDALCKRFGVDASGRQLHGALLDARLLADVYLELRGGRQPDLAMDAVATATETIVIEERAREYLAPRPHAPSEEETHAHEAFLAQIKEPLWKQS